MTTERRDQCDGHRERKKRLKAAARLLAIGALRALQGEPPIADAMSGGSSPQDRGEEGEVESGPDEDGGSE